MSFQIQLQLQQFQFENGHILDWSGLECMITNGNLWLVTGGNGSGKSTFLKVLSGIYPAYRQKSAIITGSIDCQKKGSSTTIIPSIAGRPPDFPRNITSGYVSQAPAANLISPMEALPYSTIERELAFPLEHKSTERKMVHKRLERGKSLLSEKGILFLDCPSRLSKGQQQIVSIVSLLSAGADLLLLDEPTAFLDQESVDWFWDVLLRALKETWIGACVVSTQDKRLIKIASDKVKVLSLPQIPPVDEKSSLLDKKSFQAIKSLPAPIVGPFELESFRVRNKVTEYSFGDLYLSPGEHVKIFGKNGSGKSTFCEALTGYRRTKIFGQVRVGDWSQNCGFRKYISPPRIAYAFQNAEDQITHASIFRELINPAKYERWRRYGLPLLRYVMSAGGINPWKLSYGQRKLLVFLSLCFSSSVLLMDEPFSSLDNTSSTLLNNLIKDYADHGGIVIETSSIGFKSMGATKNYVLKDGRISLQGD